MTPNARLFLILGGLNLLWGPVNLAVSTAQTGLSTGAIALFRWSLFCLCVWIGMLFPRVREVLNIKLPKGKDAVQAVLIGLLFSAPAHAMYYVALKQTSVSETTVLNTTGPLWIALLAWLILKERVSPQRWLAILIGIVGSVIVAVGFTLPTLSSGNTMGNLLYLGGAITESLAMIFAIRVIKASSGPGMLAFQLLGSTLSFSIMALALPGVMGVSVGVITPPVVAAMAYLVLVAGLFCFGAWYTFAEKAPISLMVISLGLQAPLGVLMGFFFKGEPITSRLILGTMLILAALVLAAREGEIPPEPQT